MKILYILGSGLWVKSCKTSYLCETTYIVDQALSMGIIAPLIIFASSEARKAIPRATSSTPITGTGLPSLSFETCSWTIGLFHQLTKIREKVRETHKKELNPSGSKCSMRTEEAILVATPAYSELEKVNRGFETNSPPGRIPLQRIPS